MRELEDVLDDANFGVQQLKHATPAYETADAYYEGLDPELFISDNLRVYLKDNADAFHLNLAAIPVDTVADRLNIASFTSPDPNVQAAIDAIIAENELWTWSNDAMRQAEKYGDLYIGVFQGQDGRPVLSPLDPDTSRIIYDTDLERIPEFFIRYWVEGEGNEEIERCTITYPDETWKLFRTRQGVWELFEDDEAQPIVNTLGDLPAGHLRNGLPYGSPGHERSYGMQQLITKSVLSLVGVMDFTAFPQRWVLKNPDQAQAGKLAAPTRRDGISDELAPGRSPGLTAGPGKLWELIGQSVGEFSPTELTSFTNLVDWASVQMARAERLPVKLFTDPSGQQPSGDSQRENDRSLKERVSARKRSFGAGFVKAMQKALAMLGLPNAEVNIEWARDEVSTDTNAYEAANSGADLVLKALTNPALVPFVRIKLLELGHSTDEVNSILGVASTVLDAPASDDQIGSPGELDSPDVE